MAKPAKAPLDASAFLAEVNKALAKGTTLAAAASSVLEKVPLDPEFEAELRDRGGLHFVMEHLNQQPRGRILRSVGVLKRRREENPAQQISVVRSELRDYPIQTAAGHSTVEKATPAEVKVAIQQIEQTMAGLDSHRRVLAKLVEEAEAAGVEVCGELPDDVLELCLQEGIV